MQSIMQMLETIKKSFEETYEQAKTLLAEEKADFEKEKKTLEDSNDKSDASKTEAVENIEQAVKDELDAEDEHSAASDNLKDAENKLALVKADCIEGESYADRKAKREQEIQALKDALATLRGHDNGF